MIKAKPTKCVCGSIPHIGGTFTDRKVFCFICRRKTQYYRSDTLAVEAWNRRIKREGN